jgi:hypothetical protein
LCYISVMPILDNAKQEAFCQHRAAGKTLDEAYGLAGYKPSMPAASRLSRNVNVVARLRELQGKFAAKVEVTVESIAKQLDEDRAFAIACKVPSAAVAASMAKAKLFGLAVERSVVNVSHNYAMMSEEELKFEIAALLAEARTIKAGVQH